MTDLVRPLSTSDLDEVLQLTSQAVWDGLRTQSLFITGGTGFVGKWLLECLLNAERTLDLGISLTVLTRDPDAFARSAPHLARSRAVSLMKGNVVDFEFPPGEFSSAIHAALPVARAEAGDLVEVAEAGALRVCEFAAARKVARVLHVSSGAVYGAASVGAVAEGDQWRDAGPANEYTCAKRAAERVVALEKWPFDVIVARCFAFLGPHLSVSSRAAAAQFIERAATGQGIVVEGTGSAVRAYQYASDMARWLLTCLVLGKPDRAYNVGGGEPVAIVDLAELVTRVAGTRVAVQVAGQRAEGLAGRCYVPDLTRTRSELGLINVVGLDEGIRRTLTWRAARSAPLSVST